MVLNPYSHLYEHITDLQSVIVIMTSNPLQAMDSTVHTLCTAKNRSSRNIIPLGNTETLQRSLFNMINEHTLKMIPLGMEAISDGEEENADEGANDADAASSGTATIHMIYNNPLRENNRSQRLKRDLDAIADSDSDSDSKNAEAHVEPSPIAEPEPELEKEKEKEAPKPAEREATRPLLNPYQDNTIQSELFRRLMQDGTLGAGKDMVESFRVLTRDPLQEQEYQPKACVFDMVEDNSSVRMKMRRMIRELHNDPYYDRRSLFRAAQA